MIAFIFSGQGAQYAGMGKDLYDNFPLAKEVFDTADKVLGYALTDICFNGGEKLEQTEFVQPAILTVSTAALKLLQSYGVSADYAMGLSLGEYSALVSAGAFSFEEAVALVQKRGRFMSECLQNGDYAMTAVMGLDSSVVDEVCKEASADGFVVPANYNTKNQTVIAGEEKAVALAEQLAKDKGAKRCIRLNLKSAFHTKLLEPAAIKLNAELSKLTLSSLKTPVISNVTADFVPSESALVDILTKQVMSSVLWESSVNKLLNLGVDTFIELGPGKTLSSFIKTIAKDNGFGNVKIANVEDSKSLESTLSVLGKNI